MISWIMKNGCCIIKLNTFNYVEIYVYMMDEPSRTFGKNNKDNKKESKGETKNLWKKLQKKHLKIIRKKW